MLRVIFQCVTPTSMTDASKRRLIEVSSPCHHMSQVPVTPPRGSEDSFPPGITSLEMWGNTAVEFGKFKDRESASIDNIKWMRAHRLGCTPGHHCKSKHDGTSVHKVAHQFRQWNIRAHRRHISSHGWTSVMAHRRHISTQGGTSVHKVTGTWLNWLIGSESAPLTPLN